MILIVLLGVSTVLATFNFWFYARFWFYTRTWGSAMMAMFPVVLLASRALELAKFQALATGNAYTPSEAARIFVGLMGLAACVIQAVAVLWRYDKLLKESRAEKERDGT